MADIAARPATRAATLTSWWWSVAPYVFISPFYILFAIFGAFPLGYAFWISLHEWRGIQVGEYIGFENYRLLFQDADLATALQNTAVVGVILVPSMIALSLLCAVLVNGKFRFSTVYRTSIFLPVVTSLVAVGIVFQFLFGSPYSPVISLGQWFGMPEGSWLRTEGLAKPMIVIVELWRWTGYNMILMLAGLQTIPEDLYDAARVDGASRVQTFLHITAPMMRGTIVFVSIFTTIGTFNLFDEVFLLFGSAGGPNGAGLLPGVLIYRTAFETFQFGYASAIAYAVGAIIVVLSLVQLGISERMSR